MTWQQPTTPVAHTTGFFTVSLNVSFAQWFRGHDIDVTGFVSASYNDRKATMDANPQHPALVVQHSEKSTPIMNIPFVRDCAYEHLVLNFYAKYDNKDVGTWICKHMIGWCKIPLHDLFTKTRDVSKPFDINSERNKKQGEVQLTMDKMPIPFDITYTSESELAEITNKAVREATKFASDSEDDKHFKYKNQIGRAHV